MDVETWQIVLLRCAYPCHPYAWRPCWLGAAPCGPVGACTGPNLDFKPHPTARLSLLMHHAEFCKQNQKYNNIYELIEHINENVRNHYHGVI